MPLKLVVSSLLVCLALATPAFAQPTSIEAGGERFYFVEGGVLYAPAVAYTGAPPSTVFPIPIAVPSGTVIARAGGNHELYLTPAGDVWSSGYNWSGQLGRGTVGAQYAFFPPAPTLVSSIVSTPQVGIAAGSDVSYCWDSQGVVLGWGDNRYGMFGQGGTNNGNAPPVPTPTPFSIPVPTQVVDVVSHRVLTLALDSAGQVWAWGSPSESAYLRVAPTQVALPQTAIAIAVAGLNGFALTSAGAVYLFDLVTMSPQAVTGLPAIADIKGQGSDSSLLALATDGTVWGVGNIPSSTGLFAPPAPSSISVSQVAGLSGITSIAYGSGGSPTAPPSWKAAYALDSSGQLWAWGRGTTPFLGTNAGMVPLQSAPPTAGTPQPVPTTGLRPRVTMNPAWGAYIATPSTPTPGAEIIIQTNTVNTNPGSWLFIAPGPMAAVPWGNNVGGQGILIPQGSLSQILSWIPPTPVTLPPSPFSVPTYWVLNLPPDPSLRSQVFTCQLGYFLFLGSAPAQFSTTGAIEFTIQ